MTSTLFFFIRKPTPPLSVPDTPRERLTIAAAIEADLALDGEAVIPSMRRKMIDLGRAQQRLGRDAAPVEADAAQMLALDDGRLEAELRRADGCDVAAGSAADDQDVIKGICHDLLFNLVVPVGCALM